MRARPAVLALLVAVLLAAPTLADHVYSHRFVMEGRLVGNDGLPLPGRVVTFFSEGRDFSRACGDEPQRAITDEWGDFRFCFHAHELEPSTVVGVSVGNVTVRKPMDTAFRRTVVALAEPNETGVAPPGWNETFRIAGRVWEYGTRELEGVQVFGRAVAHAPVNLTLHTPDGDQLMALGTDGYGDFDATIRLIEGVAAANVSVKIESLGFEVTHDLDGSHHRNTIGLRVAPPPPVSASFTAAPTAKDDTPGTAAPPVSPLLLVGLAFVGVVVYLVKKRGLRAK